jgi:hypothetical protein
MSDRLFPPNHEIRLLTTFKHVDDVLAQAISRLESASASPFSEFVPDAGPAERQVMADHLDRLRAVMRGFLERHGIPIPKASRSALRAAATACQHASVSVEELQGRYMQAYGPLSPAAADSLERLVAELTEVLGRMNRSLAEVKSAGQSADARAMPSDQPEH